jgi:hypothetical protein
MQLHSELIKKLQKVYEPHSLIEIRFKGLDVMFRTDAFGVPMQVFVGRKVSPGRIKGERYSRKLVLDAHGHILKDHWDRKGPAS